MQPILTPQERKELQKLLQIMQDKSKSPGERRLAMAEFDLIYEAACRSLVYGSSVDDVVYRNYVDRISRRRY